MAYVVWHLSITFYNQIHTDGMKNTLETPSGAIKKFILRYGSTNFTLGGCSWPN